MSSPSEAAQTSPQHAMDSQAVPQQRPSDDASGDQARASPGDKLPPVGQLRSMVFAPVYPRKRFHFKRYHKALASASTFSLDTTFDRLCKQDISFQKVKFVTEATVGCNGHEPWKCWLRSAGESSLTQLNDDGFDRRRLGLGAVQAVINGKSHELCILSLGFMTDFKLPDRYFELGYDLDSQQYVIFAAIKVFPLDPENFTWDIDRYAFEESESGPDSDEDSNEHKRPLEPSERKDTLLDGFEVSVAFVDFEITDDRVILTVRESGAQGYRIIDLEGGEQRGRDLFVPWRSVDRKVDRLSWYASLQHGTSDLVTALRWAGLAQKKAPKTQQ